MIQTTEYGRQKTGISLEERARWRDRIENTYPHRSLLVFPAELERFLNTIDTLEEELRGVCVVGEFNIENQRITASVIDATNARANQAEAERDALVNVFNEYGASCYLKDWVECPEFERCLEGEEPYDNTGKCWLLWARAKAAEEKAEGDA